MKATTIGVIAATSVTSLAALFAVSPRQSGPPQSQKPPPELLSADRAEFRIRWKPEESPQGDQKLEVQFDASGRKLRLFWSQHDTFNLVATSYNKIGVAYYPTAIAKGDSYGVFFVGGTTVKGFTKILKYTFAEASYNGNTLQPGELSSVDVLLVLGSNAPTKHVYSLLPNLALSDHLFVEFWNNHSIYDFDTTNGTLVRVTSTNPGEAPHWVPDLYARHNVVYARSHALNGHMYVYAQLRADPQPVAGTPIGRDLDRDGVIDDFILANQSNEQIYGLDDPYLFE